MTRILSWLAALGRDPVDGSPSSARWCAMLCVVVACVVAVADVVKHQDHSGDIAALVGGGAADLFARTRASSNTPRSGDAS